MKLLFVVGGALHFIRAICRRGTRSAELLARWRLRAVRLLPVPLARSGIVQRDVHEAEEPLARLEARCGPRAVAAKRDVEAAQPI